MAPTDPQPEDSSVRIARLAKQLGKDPASKVFLPLAEEYAKVGRFREAAALLEEGLRHYPGFTIARAALGRVYYQAGQKTEARTVLEEAIRLSPENLLAHRTLARIYLDESALDAASRSCAVLLAANPNDAETLVLRAAIESAAQGMPPDSGPDPNNAQGANAKRLARLRTWLENIRQRRSEPRRAV